MEPPLASSVQVAVGARLSSASTPRMRPSPPFAVTGEDPFWNVHWMLLYSVLNTATLRRARRLKNSDLKPISVVEPCSVPKVGAGAFVMAPVVGLPGKLGSVGRFGRPPP